VKSIERYSRLSTVSGMVFNPKKDVSALTNGITFIMQVHFLHSIDKNKTKRRQNIRQFKTAT